MTKEKVKTFFQYRMWLVLLIFLFTFVSFYWILHALNAYKPEEKFSLFAECYGLNDKESFDSIDKLLEDKKIPEFNYYLYSPDNKDIASYYSKFGSKSDLIILKESDLDEMEDTITNNFMILDDMLDGSYQYYKYTTNSYALKVYSYNDDSYNQTIKLSSMLNFENESQDNYYLLINNKSVHFNKKTTAGYLVLDSLLTKE